MKELNKRGPDLNRAGCNHHLDLATHLQMTPDADSPWTDSPLVSNETKCGCSRQVDSDHHNNNNSEVVSVHHGSVETWSKGL